MVASQMCLDQVSNLGPSAQDCSAQPSCPVRATPPTFDVLFVRAFCDLHGHLLCPGLVYKTCSEDGP